MNTAGILTCARYAYPPNDKGYCGPDQSKTVSAYLHEQKQDAGLEQILTRFETLTPYLSLIAQENNIPDPFDPRVVEAYWIGNALTSRISLKKLYAHYVDALCLPKRIPASELKWLMGKIPVGARAHHTFHVLNVFTRTGYHAIPHTVQTMDACRISWGVITNISSTTADVLAHPLILHRGKLALGAARKKQVATPAPLHARIGDHISFHWNVACDILSTHQVKRLHTFTRHAITLANLTL